MNDLERMENYNKNKKEEEGFYNVDFTYPCNCVEILANSPEEANKKAKVLCGNQTITIMVTLSTKKNKHTKKGTIIK